MSLTCVGERERKRERKREGMGQSKEKTQPREGGGGEGVREKKPKQLHTGHFIFTHKCFAVDEKNTKKNKQTRTA